MLFFIACKNDLNEAKKFADPKNASIEESKDIKLIHKELGVTNAIITAPLMYRYTKEERRITFPEGLTVELYQDGTPTVIIKAGYGKRDEGRHLLEMSKGIKMKNYKKEEIEADSLTWEESKATISIQGQVRIKTPTDIIQGYGLVSDDNFRNYTLQRITGVVQVKGNNVPE